MPDQTHVDAEAPRRLRRGAPPRLYVIAREAPVPWLRLRRLGEADRSSLLAHFRQLLHADPTLLGRTALEEDALCACIAVLDLRAVVLFGAIAGNSVIAAACTLPGAAGSEVVATVDPSHAGRGLPRMLAAQVLGTAPGPVPEAAEPMARLMLSLGGRITQPDEAAQPAE